MDLSQEIRPAAVAGLFYPENTGELTRCLERMEADLARAEPLPGLLKALIVPHAGYVYSGPVAAQAYQCLKARFGTVERVVLLGPAHYLPLPGLALPGVLAFQTPLGTVPVDVAAIQRIESLPQVFTSPEAHAPEHSLEVQLPFLQRALGAFQVVPLAVGHVAAETVAKVIEALWGGPETVIVVSSDLSHYLPYEVAQLIDQQTCAAIAELKELDSHEQACGAIPINGLLIAARQHGLKPHLMALRNSGDTTGDRHRVVGYAAFVFAEAPDHER